MKVNEEKAKELIELADRCKKTSQMLLNFESGNNSETELGKLGRSFEDLVHVIGKQTNGIAELIYETFPE